jgi:hypothetical protein
MPERRRHEARMDQLSEEFAAVEDKVRRHAAISELVRNAAIVLLIVFVWVATYYGRRDDAERSRAGCVRSAIGHLTNAGAWEVAAGVRRGDGDQNVAAAYQRHADRLERLAGVGKKSVRAFNEDEARGIDVIAYPPGEILAVCRQRFPGPNILLFR